MDIRELKQLLKHSASILIMENGEPSLVVVDYKTYRAMSGISTEPVATPTEPTGPVREERPQPSLSNQEMEMIDRLNKEILALKEQIEAEERGVLGQE